MINRATLSILGLMEFDDTLFSDIVLPPGVDSELVVDAICMDCAELELLYPDWDCMKEFIAIWSNRELSTWQKLADMAALEYNPIENYDRIEDSTDNESRVKSNNKNDSITNASRGNSVNSTDDTTRVAGYNSDTLAVQDKGSGASASTSNASGESTQTTRETETDSAGRVHSSRIHGNIGVTTPAQMITSELELAPKINVVNYIADSFKRRFCLMVY